MCVCIPAVIAASGVALHSIVNYTCVHSSVGRYFPERPKLAAIDEYRRATSSALPQNVTAALAARHSNVVFHTNFALGRDSIVRAITSPDVIPTQGGSDRPSNIGDSHSPSHSLSTLGSDFGDDEGSEYGGDPECPAEEWDSFNYNIIQSSSQHRNAKMMLQKSKSSISIDQFHNAGKRKKSRHAKGSRSSIELDESSMSHRRSSIEAAAAAAASPHSSASRRSTHTLTALSFSDDDGGGSGGEIDEPTSPMSAASLLVSALWPTGNSSPDSPQLYGSSDDAESPTTKDTLVSVVDDAPSSRDQVKVQNTFSTARVDRSPAVGFAIVGSGIAVLTLDTLLIRLASEGDTDSWAIAFYRYLFYVSAITQKANLRIHTAAAVLMCLPVLLP